MSDLLSIVRAAKEQPDKLALITEERSLTFAEIASLVQERRHSRDTIRRAEPTLDCLIDFYWSLENHRSITLLSREATDNEFSALAKRIPTTNLNTALLLFTSGSEGLAKGVLLSRTALIASAQGSLHAIPLTGQDRWLCALPLSHIGGLSILSRCLQSRTALVLSPGFDAGAVAESIASNRVTHISLVPTMLWRLLDLGFQAPEHLAVTLIGGAPLSPELGARAERAGFSILQTYGMTECCSQVVTDGYPLPGVQLRLSNGELEVSGPMLMNGYLPPHDSDDTFSDGWLRTGDLASLDEDGRVKILGRSDEMIISGGENIDPRKIEESLLRDERIEQAYALGVDHQEWGQELVALIVCRPIVTRENLSPNAALHGHRLPKRLLCVNSLPLLPNGKIDRQRAKTIATAIPRT